MKKITEEIRVFLATEEEDTKLRRFLHKRGWKWGSGMSIMDFPMRANGNTLVILPNKRVARSASADYAISLEEFENDYVNVV